MCTSQTCGLHQRPVPVSRGVFVAQVNKLQCGLAFHWIFFLSTPILDASGNVITSSVMRHVAHNTCASGTVHHIHRHMGHRTLVEEFCGCNLLEDLKVYFEV